jgi:maltooligosyltrehalose trehalohydrolase
VIAVDNVLGATPRGDGIVEFRVWAPAADSLRIRLNGIEHELEACEDGFWGVDLAAGHGDEYVYVVDGHDWPDPCSRWQPHGVRGPSAVVDLPRPAESDGLSLDDLVLYELHVGTFSPEGTFDGVIPHLHELRDLGVTAIELMPVATFPGDRGWGYDGLYTWAPHPAYGGPDGLLRRSKPPTARVSASSSTSSTTTWAPRGPTWTGSAPTSRARRSGVPP